jgi:hypothetical protein
MVELRLLPNQGPKFIHAEVKFMEIVTKAYTVSMTISIGK